MNWKKSTFSQGDGACVELADLGDGQIAVRDSKLGENSPVLNFTGTELKAFLDGAKAGEFDGFV